MRLAAFVALLTLPAPAFAQAPTDRNDDLLTVLAAALYPLEIMAYCHREVAHDPAFLDAGRQWSERNGALLANLEDKAKAAGVPEGARRTADEQALAAIKAAVAGQADKPAYCRFVARVIDGGYYDIDQRDDLKPALKPHFKRE
jgi:hypothetical protein